MTQVDLADLLRVHTRQGPDDTKVIYSWAVHYSRRRKAAAEVKARRTAARMSSGRSSFGTFGLTGGFGMGAGYGSSGRRDAGYGSAAGGETASSAEAEAERIVRVLSEYATAARAETVWAEGTVEIAGAGPAAGERARRRRRADRGRPRGPPDHRLARAAQEHLEPDRAPRAAHPRPDPAGDRRRLRKGKATGTTTSTTSRAGRTPAAASPRRPSSRTAARAARSRSPPARPPSPRRRPGCRWPAPRAARPRRS